MNEMDRMLTIELTDRLAIQAFSLWRVVAVLSEPPLDGLRLEAAGLQPALMLRVSRVKLRSIKRTVRHRENLTQLCKRSSKVSLRSEGCSNSEIPWRTLMQHL